MPASAGPTHRSRASASRACFPRWLRSAPSAIPQHSAFLHADPRRDSSRGWDNAGMAASLSAAPRRARRDRLASVDALRGFVMVVMALDHVRDFIHRGAMSQSPTDLATATPMLFLTRWVTHICAPVFMFTAGIGAYCYWRGSGPVDAGPR